MPAWTSVACASNAGHMTREFLREAARHIGIAAIIFDDEFDALAGDFSAICLQPEPRAILNLTTDGARKWSAQRQNKPDTKRLGSECGCRHHE